jgi:hypothetical protein
MKNKRTLILIITIIMLALAATATLSACNPSALVNFNQLQQAFEAEGYTVTQQNGGLVALTLPNDEFWIFRYNNVNEADDGLQVAKMYLNETLTLHRSGVYIWFGTEGAITLFNGLGLIEADENFEYTE